MINQIRYQKRRAERENLREQLGLRQQGMEDGRGERPEYLKALARRNQLRKELRLPTQHPYLT